MSLSSLRKNFYRIRTLITEYGADAMRCLLHYFIQNKHKISFKDFVSKHQHEIYHQFNIDKCCQCSTSYRRPFKTVIRSWQMDTLFDNNCPKLSCHKHSSKSKYCCSTVKKDLKLVDIDITLLRFFLVNYFEEEFWKNCLIDEESFHSFLNKHKHDIFHLVELNSPCCLCKENPDYTVLVVAEKDQLKNSQWETMFSTSNQHCQSYKTCVDKKNPCSVSATKGINLENLDIRSRRIILSKFCIMMTHIDKIVDARNLKIAHPVTEELSDENFRKLWDEIEISIIYLSKITGTYFEKTRCILELKEKSLEEALCLETQCLLLRKMQGHQLITQEFCKLQQESKLLGTNIARTIEEVRLKVASLTFVPTNKTTKVKNQQLDDLKKSISNCERVLLIISMIFILVGGADIIYLLYFATVYLHDCPAEKNIPIFIIVVISVVVVFLIMIKKRKGKEKMNWNTWKFIVICFMVSWWIAGNVWIYRTYGHISTVDPEDKNYCNATMYFKAFGLIGFMNLCVVVLILICIRKGCIACCKDTKPKKLDNGPYMPILPTTNSNI